MKYAHVFADSSGPDQSHAGVTGMTLHPHPA
ncbi:hypothetical protein LCGC14_1844970 [marine sediment metagenome]|uniref:Uncharacterized protein n=1 Tax=marine sediment metagenome TaxID=412755 RepID=A0A0F9IRN7_9ZZZZ